MYPAEWLVPSSTIPPTAGGGGGGGWQRGGGAGAGTAGEVPVGAWVRTSKQLVWGVAADVNNSRASRGLTVATHTSLL
jgi:hypothetical protein